MNKMQYFLKKHSSTILTVGGVAGVVGTSVLAVKATPKAMLLLEDAKRAKGEDLTPVEVVKVAWKPYIPAVVTGFGTIACICGIKYLSAKNQATLMSAYALLEQGYKEYRDKVNDIYGEEADRNVKQEIVKAKYNGEEISDPDKMLFFDYYSMNFFESTMDSVLRAESEFLKILEERTYACINEYYDILALPHVEFGYQLGWFDVESNDPYNCKSLEFNYEITKMDDGTECCIITTNMPPAADYIL